MWCPKVAGLSRQYVAEDMALQPQNGLAQPHPHAPRRDEQTDGAVERAALLVTSAQNQPPMP